MEFHLADLFESVAAAVPDREAIVCGDRRVTYAELDERSTRLAHVLAKVGVKRGDHIGLYLYATASNTWKACVAEQSAPLPSPVTWR